MTPGTTRLSLQHPAVAHEVATAKPEPRWSFGAPAGAARSAARGGALDVIKRAQGGSDFDLDRLVALCPPCHAQTDAPYARGRLIVTPLGAGRFTAEVTRGGDKWATRA
jgi:hypothetical protein